MPFFSLYFPLFDGIKLPAAQNLQAVESAVAVGESDAIIVSIDI